jgi:fermentation-respiration switch protein FrsA (DUF1100 family)
MNEHNKTRIIIIFFLFGCLFSGCTVDVSQSDLFRSKKTLKNQKSSYPYTSTRGRIALNNNGDSSEYLYISRPDAKTDVIFFGGRDWRIDSGMSFYKALVRDIPVNVFTASYRGYGEAEGTASVGTLKSDAEAALKFFDERFRTKNRLPLTVVGFSLGGFVASTLSENRSVSGLVIVSSFTSSRDLAAFYLSQHLLAFASYFVNFRIEPALLEMDTVAQLRNYGNHLLVIYGGSDTVIPPYMGKQILERAASLKKKIYQIENCGHDEILSDEAYQKRVVSEIGIFISELDSR